MTGGNQAISTNAAVFRHADREISRHGSDWLFTVCALMGLATLIFWSLSLTKSSSSSHHKRLFHHLVAGATFVSCIAYFTMGSNLGQVPIVAEWPRGGRSPVAQGVFSREIFYVRYIDWFVTMPLLLTGLFLTARPRLPLSTILSTVLANWVMVVCFLVGSLIQTRYKWGYFTFATAALLFVLWQMVWDARRHAAVLGGPVYRTYLTASALLVVPWLLYPVAWGLSEGGNVIHPDSEAIFYGILDLVSKIVFGAVLLYGHRKVGPAVNPFMATDHVDKEQSKATQSTGQLMTEHHAENGQAAGGDVANISSSQESAQGSSEIRVSPSAAAAAAAIPGAHTQLQQPQAKQQPA
ncbi:FDD123 protein [Apodospora peruviana]|uniref:FDD123 protein n=1 Tax=Apodospora peruviana TaxID=516989 RepID=A0AAE0ITE1_9PEZI|nr:FDD123 protein [Apodospora peruviana]